MLILPERCDGDGNLYLRIGADERAIIRKISPDGKKAMAILKGPIPDTAHPYPGTFNVDAQSTVYQLASVGMQRYVFIFDSDGDLKAKVKLDPGFEWLAGFVAPFASGRSPAKWGSRSL